MIAKFLKFVEITTKITCIFSFLMALAFLFFSVQTINVPLTLVYFASMFIFDLTTTAINNYIDSKDYPKMLPIPRRAALISIIVMFLVSTALGLYLACCTDIVVLLIGVLYLRCMLHLRTDTDFQTSARRDFFRYFSGNPCALPFVLHQYARRLADFFKTQLFRNQFHHAGRAFTYNTAALSCADMHDCKHYACQQYL